MGFFFAFAIHKIKTVAWDFIEESEGIEFNHIKGIHPVTVHCTALYFHKLYCSSLYLTYGRSIGRCFEAGAGPLSVQFVLHHSLSQSHMCC